MAKGEELRLRYTVKGTNRTDLPAISMIAIGEDHELAYRAEYQWRLNGMTFAENNHVRMNTTF